MYRLLIAATLAGTAGNAWAQPASLVYQGFLQDGAGDPVNDLVDLEFRFFAVPTGGSAVKGPLSFAGVSIENGLFSVVLTDLSADDFPPDTSRWLALSVNGEELSPRQQLGSVPWALRAERATAADDLACSGCVTFDHWAPVCAEGDIPKLQGGVWACGQDTGGGPSSGDITSVNTPPGSGLTGGAEAGEVTLGLAVDGVTTDRIADGTILFDDWAQNGCLEGEVPKWDQTGSIWVCALPVFGMCPAGQTVTGVDGAGVLVCDAASRGVVEVDAGDGLLGGPITSSGTISVAFGGSGLATTVARSDHDHAGVYSDVTHSHDGDYYTQPQLNSSDGTAPNTGANRVHWDVLSGVPAGFADGVDADSGGDITSVTTGAGSGLTGGVLTGDANLSIATGGVTTTMIADGTITSSDLANDSVGNAQAGFTVIQDSGSFGIVSVDAAIDGDVRCGETGPGAGDISVPAGETWYLHLIGTQSVHLPAGAAFWWHFIYSTNGGATWNDIAGGGSQYIGDLSTAASSSGSATASLTLNGGTTYRFAMEAACTTLLGGSCPFTTASTHNSCSWIGFITGRAAL